jgi:hypothetical protein
MVDLKLKKETGVFEYLCSRKFNDIVKIIEKLSNNSEIKITARSYTNNDDFLDDTDIHTSHYRNNFDDIFKRRSKRFLDDIKGSNNILFIREDGSIDNQQTTKEDIINFNDIIHKINSGCNFKLLLLSEKNHYNEIIYDKLIHREYNISKYKDYIKECYQDIL